MVGSRYLIVISIVLFIATRGYSQTADKVLGCVPLEVNFTAPNQTGYYWTFGDNASSELQNPTHAYTNPGNYTAELFDGVNGTKIGEIEITVFADPEITITASPTNGCSPLEVQFMANIVLDPSINIVSYLWSFGDGNSSTLADPNHTFIAAGTYDVSLSIVTDLPECNKTIINEEFIISSGAQGSFQVTNTSGCNVPAIIEFNNLSENDANNNYLWDFGNGDDFVGFAPPNITYTVAGEYEISLTIIDEAGCESIIIRKVTAGLPVLNIMSPDSVCVNENVLISNTSEAVNFSWNFGVDASPSTSASRNPIFSYSSIGSKVVTLEITDFRGCKNDTTFIIDVSSVTADFTYSPDPLPCNQPLDMIFTAVNTTYANYNWSITDENGPIINHEQSWPVRDSLHLHWEDSLDITLMVVSSIGCTAEQTKQIRQRKPDAYFLVNTSKGCAPLNIQFTDDTRSIEDVISWTWIYGDGEEITYTNDDDHNYVYEEPGEYYAQLIIENERGCIDTSAGVWILVGEPIPSEYTLDKSEICLGDTINLNMLNLDERIDSWHFSTDNNRMNHCWNSPNASHVFVHEPGIFPLTITTEYNGCYWTETEQNAIQANGAKANLSYMTNCESPFDVMFNSESKNAVELSWDVETPSEYNIDSFTHTFTNKGIYKVFLTADDNSGCPISIDSATVHIVKPEANFTLPEYVCDNVEYTLDASASVDVNETCHKGYLWNLPNNRPRELGDPEVETFFLQPGDQDVQLIVEDINGCTDTLVKQTRSFSIQPNFLFDKNRICLPSTVSFTDISTSDTSIVSWNWSFGETDSLTTFTFDENTDVPIQAALALEDAVGCRDTQAYSIQVYEPISEITLDNGPNICIGEEINFSATDFTSEGSFLNFNWDFGPFGTGNNQEETVLFDENGLFDITLNFEEDSTGCTGETSVQVQVVDIPVADFMTPVDNEVEICHPAIIEFTNQSTWEGPVIHRWNFGNGNTSLQVNPAEAFAKGTYDVNLIVQSVYGCSDTIVKTYNLVGPEGELVIDKNVICPGETLNVELINPVDVNAFTWVLGDGTIVDDVNPLSHTYDFYPPGGQTKIDLILKSTENGCEFIITEPITLIELQADFEFSDSSHCEGLVYFENTSTGDFDATNWDFGDGSTSSESSPSYVYDQLGMYEVTLEVTSNGAVCRSEISKEVRLDEVEEYIFFPNVFTPNGDGLNDYFNVVVKPQFQDVVSISTFQVYNRWGNLVYDNETPDVGWDGNKQSAPSPAEVYAYYIQVEVIDCDNKVQKGNVTIVR